MIVYRLLLLSLLGCTTLRETQPKRTTTEQLLFSTAVDRVVDVLVLNIPEGSRIYVDSAYVDGTDSKYLVAALRDRLLRHGGRLAAFRAQADLVFEPRIGALSIDRKKSLVGVPGFAILIPLAGELNVPDLALFKRDRRQGVVKLALTGYDAATGELWQSLGPVYGFSQQADWVALIFFGWQSNDLFPTPPTTTG